MPDEKIPCFNKITLPDFSGLKDKFNNLYKDGMSEREQREIGKKIALDAHKELFDDLNKLKKKAGVPTEKYVSPDNSEKIKSINDRYDKLIEDKKQEIQSQNKTNENAIREPQTGTVLQRQQEGTGSEGSERGRMESGKQGNEPPTNEKETENTGEEENVSGIAQRVREKRAVVLNETPAEKGEGWSPEKAIEIGKDLVENKGIIPEDILKDYEKDDLINGKRMAVVNYEANRLAKVTENAGDTYGQDSQQFKDAKQEENDWLKRTKPMQTEWQRTGAAQQGETNIDTGSFTSTRQAVEKSTGKPITENQSKTVKTLTAKVKELNKTVEDLHKKFVETIDNWVKEYKKQNNVNKAKKIIEGNKKVKGEDADLIFQSAKRDYVAAKVAKSIGEGKTVDDAVDEVAKEGLIKPENVDKAKVYFNDLVGETKEPMTAEEKNIKRLEKKLSDLREGLKKEKPEQREKTDAEKDLEKEIQDEKDKQLVQSFAGKKGNNFTPEEVKNIWDYAKRNYVDKGENVNNIVRKTAIDLGLSNEQVLRALEAPKGSKSISTKMFAIQNRRAEVQNKVKEYVRTVDRPKLIKWATAIPHFFFQKAIALHGTVGFITHAGLNIFRPSIANIYWPLFFKQFKNSFGGLSEKGLGEYEKSMTFLRNNPLFWTAKQAGVKVDPSQVNDDYAVVKKLFGRLGTMGDRGFNTLKEFRMAYFENEYNRLSDAEKADPETLKRIGQLVNHGSGTSNFSPGEVLNTAVFAPRLEASKWARVIVDPAKAMFTLGKMATGKDVSLAEKAAAKLVVRKSAEFLGAYMTSLAINNAMLIAAGSQQRVNFTDPTKKDWFKFKGGDSNIDVSGGIISTVDFLGHLLYLPTETNKELSTDEHSNRIDAFTKLGSNYAFSKLSPFASTSKEIFTAHDYNGNTMPWSDDKPKNKYAHKLDWKEYLLTEQAPIFIASGAQATYESMKDRGMSDAQINDILTGIVKGAIEGGTGTHVSPDYSLEQKGTGGGGGYSSPSFKVPKPKNPPKPK